MEAFLRLVSNLTQIIREDSSLDSYSFDLILLADISRNQLSQIKPAVKDIELIQCDEFWEFTEEIYKRLMLPTISLELKAYFIKLQQNTKDLSEITYQFNPWKEFKLTTSESNNVVLAIKTDYAEKQLQSFLDHLEIKDTTWKDDLYDFDYAFNFESEIESLFRDITFDCWQTAKQETQSQLRTTLKEVNGGSHSYDLDTKQSVK